MFSLLLLSRQENVDRGESYLSCSAINLVRFW
jgi:hypothetical protein